MEGRRRRFGVIAKYLLRRVVYTIPSLFAITVIIFVVIRIVPGDILVTFYGPDELTRLTPQQRASIIEALGLADPLIVQYLSWLGDIATGDLGTSFFRTRTVAEVIAHRGPISMEIALFATVISWLVGFPVGIISALMRNSISDYVGRFLTILFLAIPAFWLGMLMVLGLVLAFRYKSPVFTVQIWQDPIPNLSLVWGPALVLGLSTAAYMARMSRSSLLEVMGDDYIRTARSKGLSEWMVLIRHAVRNAILPVITVSGVLLGFLLGGSIAVEKAFGVKGMGDVLIHAISERDIATIQNLVLFYGVIFTLINILVDTMYAWLDPRIRYS